MKKIFFYLSLLLFLSVFVGLRADGNASNRKAFIVSPTPPKPLESAKEILIEDGMTLKMIVADLGPGWVSPNEGAGVIQWRFADGRSLNVLPHWDDRDDSSEIITYKGHGGMERMWWTH